MLHLDVKVGQWVDLPGFGKIYVGKKSGKIVKLGFEMPRDQKVTLLPFTGEDEQRMEAALYSRP